VERRVVRDKVGAELLPTFKGKEAVMVIEVSPSERNPAQLDEASIADLVKEAVGEAKGLVRLEVELAGEELKEELRQVRRAAIAFGVALGSTVVVLCLLAVALVLALGGTPLVAVALAGGFVGIAGVTGSLGYGMLPKTPFGKTRHRLQNNMNQLKEHIA
jgi:uncharacterized membrane protein YqjE